MENKMKDEGKVSSLKKSLDVLNCFIKDSKLGVTQISRKLGISKSHVYKILSTYESMGYIEQDQETEKYELGFQVFVLSKALGEKFIITKVASPYLQELANQSKQRVYMAMPYENQVLYLDAFYPIGEIGLMRNVLGEKSDMYCTGLGKAMLASMSDDAFIKYCEQTNFTGYTDNTILTAEDLSKEVARIRKRGYAIDDMEHEFGIRCLAMPVFNRNHQLLAAISISGSAVMMREEYMLTLAKILKKTVQEIEGRL